MDPITLRFAERLVAVLFGGMAIYLGYRLFLLVPDRRGGEGRFTFPWDVSVVLARVGPGVFFALFGALVVGTSLVRGVEWRDGEVAFHGAGASLAVPEAQARDAARVELLRDIALLNNISGYLRGNLPEQDRSLIERAIPRIKLALMKPVWGDPAKGWGDPAEFERWQEGFESDPPPARLKAAVEFYRYGRPAQP
jgi:hypothetical protein